MNFNNVSKILILGFTLFACQVVLSPPDLIPSATAQQPFNFATSSLF
ncbi:MAG: hypothetical protein IBX69_01060 [Anaerolineales bacterium]|nr:hypothetical protein [Anaerolineales bacterium]